MPRGIYKEGEEVDRKSNLLTVFNDKIWAYASLASIGLGWKGLSGTNTLAYYNHLSIVDVKSFITLGPDQSGDPH